MGSGGASRRTAQRALGALLHAVVVILLACGGDDTPVLLVDVRTDLVPLVEFDSVRVTVDDRSEAYTAGAMDDFVAGRRVAEIAGLVPGRKSMRVALNDASGAVVVARDVVFAFDGDLGLAVVINRRCIGVACDAASTCHDGRCLPPECSSLDPSACGDPECAVDGDCTGTSPCSRGVCATGLCLSVPEDSLCASGEVCDPALGCRGAPDGGARDGGSSDGGLRDAGLPDAAPIDAGPCDPTAFVGPGEPVVLGVSPHSEPEISGDGLTLYFVAAGPGGDSDLWSATRSGLLADFDPPVPLGLPNTTSEDTDPSITLDQSWLFYRSDRTGNRDLFVADRGVLDGMFRMGVELGVNTSGVETDPAISADGLELFFVGNPGTGSDIYVSTRATTMDEFVVRNRVTELSSPGFESSMFLTRDGTALYFASDRSGGEGGTDIWVATRTGRGSPFGTPVNVRALNTPDTDDNPTLTADRRRIFFTRDSTTTPDLVHEAVADCP